MRDKEKSKEQLISELVELRQRGKLLSPAFQSELRQAEEALARANELLEEKDRLLAAFHQIGQVTLSSLDLEHILDTLARQVVEAGIFRSLMVALVEEKTHTVRVVKTLTRSIEGGVPRIESGAGGKIVARLVYGLDDDNITAEVARTGEMQVIEGWDERFDARVARPEDLRGTIAYFIPVMERDRVVAVLATGSQIEEKEETLRRIEAMRPLLGQVAIALKHAQLYDALEKALRREEAMGRIRDQILAMREFPELRAEFENKWVEELRALGIPVHQASLQLPASRAGFFLSGWAALSSEESNLSAHSVADYPWLQKAWDSGEPVVVPRALLNKIMISNPDARSLVEVPLPGGGSVGLNSNVEDAFDPETVQTLRIFAGVIAEGLHRVQDFEALRRTEQALAQHVEELARSNTDLEQFAYVASHDLQEPLRMVSSYMQLLQRRYEGRLDANADEFIDFAVDGAVRMQTLIDDLLAYSRLGTQGKGLEPTDCEVVFDQVLANLQVAIEEDHAVVSHDPLPTVMADGVQLSQLFQNLIGNAIKFHREEPPQVHVAAALRSDEWVFSVRDNGIGLEPGQFERIFLIFQRLHGRNEYPGTGIGLAICKRIVERHNGRIWVESAPGQGTIFHFTIPAGLN